MTDFKTSDRDVNRAIRSWLREDRHEDVSRVAGFVLDQVEATPQRRATWWPARRTPTMNKILGFGLAAVAVVAVLIVGAQLFGSGGVGAGPTTTPEPSVAAPTATPEPSVAEPSASADTGLPVGSSYVIWDAPGEIHITVTIPAPLWYGDGGILVKEENADPPDGAGIINFQGPLSVYGDPCQWSSTTPDTPATTVDELVAALAAQASRDATAPVDVTVGGFAGKSITLHVPDDAVFSECDQGMFGSWTVGEGLEPYRYHQGPGQIDELWILDVNGMPVIIDTAYYAGTPEEDVEELRAIVESATFESP